MSIKVTFDFANSQIVVEGEQGDLLKIAEQAKALAPTLSEIRILTQKIQSAPAKGDVTLESVPGQVSRQPSIREFGRSLNLSNTYERIAALAYHANKIQGRASFSVKEVSDWFGLCGFQKPAQMPTALADAKRRYGYVENKGRDQWCITTGGENIIIGLLESQRQSPTQ